MHNHKSREGASYSSDTSFLISTTGTELIFTTSTNKWRILPFHEDLLHQRENQENRSNILIPSENQIGYWHHLLTDGTL